MNVATHISKMALASLVFSASVAAQAAPQPCRDVTGEKGRENVCRLSNVERQKQGRTPLILDSRLSRVAQAHADDMYRRKYFSHRSPEGRDMGDRLDRANVSYGTAGENIAWGQKTETDVTRAWMHSSGHRRNILSRNYKKIGIGRTGNYWVQVFTD